MLCVCVAILYIGKKILWKCDNDETEVTPRLFKNWKIFIIKCRKSTTTVRVVRSTRPPRASSATIQRSIIIVLVLPSALTQKQSVCGSCKVCVSVRLVCRRRVAFERV